MAHTNSLGNHRTRFARSLDLTCCLVLVKHLTRYTGVFPGRPNTRPPASRWKGRSYGRPAGA